MKKKTFIKIAKILCNLNILLLEQILDIEGLYLLIWQQLKTTKKKSRKGKKATWYKEIEEQVLISKEKREVKDEFKTGMINTLGYKTCSKKFLQTREDMSGLSMKIVSAKAER